MAYRLTLEESMKSQSHVTGTTNIIWIFGDQHRAQALSCNGDDFDLGEI
ncbi:MAG: hypothetical protein ACOCU4_00950 [Alkalispirochaeta sp.]